MSREIRTGDRAQKSEGKGPYIRERKSEVSRLIAQEIFQGL